MNDERLPRHSPLAMPAAVYREREALKIARGLTPTMALIVRNGGKRLPHDSSGDYSSPFRGLMKRGLVTCIPHNHESGSLTPLGETVRAVLAWNQEHGPKQGVSDE